MVKGHVTLANNSLGLERTRHWCGAVVRVVGTTSGVAVKWNEGWWWSVCVWRGSGCEML